MLLFQNGRLDGSSSYLRKVYSGYWKTSKSFGSCVRSTRRRRWTSFWRMPGTVHGLVPLSSRRRIRRTQHLPGAVPGLLPALGGIGPQTGWGQNCRALQMSSRDSACLQKLFVYDAGSAHGNKKQNPSAAQECYDEDRNPHGSSRGVAPSSHVYHISTGA